MNIGTLYSLILHIAILAVLIFTPDKTIKDLSNNFMPIPVEILNIEEETLILKEKKAPAPKKIEEYKENNLSKEKPKPIEVKKPKVEKIIKPKIDPIPEPEPTVEKVLEEDLIKIKPLPEPKTKKKEIIKNEKKSPPKPTIKPKIKNKKTEELKNKPRTFASVLKDLKKNKSLNKSQEVQLDSKNDGEAMAGKIGDHVSISEMDSVRRQIQKCWNIPAGLRDAYNMIIDVEVDVAIDGNVKSAKVLNNRSNDPQFRAAAESARRATLNPKCNPLKLPREKYSKWKKFVFRFNPKELM